MKRLALWQAGVVLLVGVVAFFFAGFHGALSAWAGGLAVWIGTQLGAVSMRANKNKNHSPGTALLLLLRAEAIKIVVIALLLLLVFKLYASLVPAALIGGLAVAALLSGLGIMRANEQK